MDELAQDFETENEVVPTVNEQEEDIELREKFTDDFELMTEE